VTVRLVAFARARELLAERSAIEVRDGARICDVWNVLLDAIPALRELHGVRFAVGGAFADGDRVVRHDEELAILPAVGGG
jgi:molybdopterin converting factor small subunit